MMDKVEGNRNLLQSNSPSEDTLYIHWRFHPTDIKKNTVCEIYNKTLKNHDNFSQMRIAMIRQKNLSDILCHMNLSELPGRNTSDLLAKLKGDEQRQIQHHGLTSSLTPPC
jgi:hypothetical protein